MQSEEMKDDFERDGYYVLRGVLAEGEVDELAAPIRAAFTRGDYDTYRQEAAYPAPGIHSMGPRVLDDNPELAALSLAHPKIVAAVEKLFGEPATLAQYWSIMRPPGAGVDAEPFIEGSGTHYDYKPWRCVGSYVKWMFAVVPFVDYTKTVGPLVVAPGSHQQTTLLPSNGRVHQVDAAKVPKPEDITLVDPSLKKGDVVLMHGFTWHEARPNYGNSDRCGLYMKFHAKSSPPACGPTIYPSAVHEALRDEAKHLIPYHRGDGAYAALRDKPVGGVDEATLLIEDSEDRVLVLGDASGRWRLPTFAAAEDETAGILDVGNVMGSVVQQARAELGLSLPWLSWLQDIVAVEQTAELSAPKDDTLAPAAGSDSNTVEWRMRVYGHRLSVAAPSVRDDVQLRWTSVDELTEMAADELLHRGAQVLQWLHMWRLEQDENGQPVTRSFGVPTTHVQYYAFNRNGNADGTYRVGEFDEHGLPLATL